MNRLILITNPGSASRKYALYNNEEFLCSVHFEYEEGKVIATRKDAAGEKKVYRGTADLGDSITKLREILTEEKYISDERPLAMMVARVAAPGEYFTSDHVVDEECLRQLEQARDKAPLHVPVVAAEINNFRRSFSTVPIVAVSDSEFHKTRPELMKYYAFDTKLADKAEIKRYGYHGLSVGYVTELLREREMLPEKLIVCHIGSGASVTAVYGGRSIDTSMGYSPLEGLMMSTRVGSMDVAAALQVKRELRLDDDGLEKYLNKKAGLLGVSGSSDDMRDIIQKRDEGDACATFAHALYVYRIQNLIGQMAASMGGVDGIVWTATVGERSWDVRYAVMQKTRYLGFEIDQSANKELGEIADGVVNIGTASSKPVLVVKTDETAMMVKRGMRVMDAQVDI